MWLLSKIHWWELYNMLFWRPSRVHHVTHTLYPPTHSLIHISHFGSYLEVTIPDLLLNFVPLFRNSTDKPKVMWETESLEENNNNKTNFFSLHKIKSDINKKSEYFCNHEKNHRETRVFFHRDHSELIHRDRGEWDRESGNEKNSMLSLWLL